MSLIQLDSYPVLRNRSERKIRIKILKALKLISEVVRYLVYDLLYCYTRLNQNRYQIGIYR